MAADDLQPMAENLGGQHLHGGVFQIGLHIVGLDAGSIDLLKEIDAHPQVHIAHAVDGQADGVLTGIKHAILTGTVVLELQQVVAVLQSIDILGLPSVNQFHNDSLHK